MDTKPIINKLLAFSWILANIKHSFKVPRSHDKQKVRIPTINYDEEFWFHV